MIESDNAAEKAVAARPMTLAQSVNAWMNLGHRLFKAIMEIWSRSLIFPCGSSRMLWRQNP